MATTAALLFAAVVRVAGLKGLAGVSGLFLQTLLPVVLCVGGLVAADRYETLTCTSLWPGSRFRQRLLLGLLAVLDCYFVLILVFGERLAVAVDL